MDGWVTARWMFGFQNPLVIKIDFDKCMKVLHNPLDCVILCKPQLYHTHKHDAIDVNITMLKRSTNLSFFLFRFRG